MATTTKWKKNAIAGNSVLSGKGFYVSYSPCPTLDFTGTGRVSETALFKEGEPWRILSGDFRKEYSKLVPKGFKACVKFYEKNIDKRNGHSTDEIARHHV